jgi:hypothetical protein
MAKHKARSLRASALITGALTACAALAVSLVGATSANAAGPGKTVKPKNADVLGTCSLTVLSVNPSVGTAHIRVAAQGQPNNLLGYATNVYTQVACAVYDGANNLVALYAPFKNSATLPTSNINPDVAFSSSYTLCGQAFVKKNNGTQSLTPVVCA